MMFALLILLPALGHAQGAFMFEEDEEAIVSHGTVAPAQVSRPRPSAVSPNDRGLRSPGRQVARGERLPPSTPVRRGHYHGDGHNHSHDDEDRQAEGIPPCRDCSRERRGPQARQVPVTTSQIYSTPTNMRTPVWATFARSFAGCAPGCQPAGIGIHRPHDGGMSCHHMDRAIDVGAMVCGGQTFRAINGGRFKQMVTCMRGKMKTIYQQPHKLHLGYTQAHYDHAHFSIGCYGGSYY